MKICAAQKITTDDSSPFTREYGSWLIVLERPDGDAEQSDVRARRDGRRAIADEAAGR